MEGKLPLALAWAAAQWEGRAPLEPERLAGDASPRAYFRLRRKDAPGTRLLLLGPDESENLRWLVLGRELWLKGFPLPRILSADLGRGLFLLEDLGERRLDRVPLGPRGGPPWAYLELVRVVARLHREGPSALSRVKGLLSEEYSPDFAFEHEWGYFLKGLGLLGIHVRQPFILEIEARAVAREAAGPEEEHTLIHRDLQSRNVMMVGAEPFLLDWQGARMGPAAYDLASLLFDPYRDLGPSARGALLNAYLGAAGSEAAPQGFSRRVLSAALMRLMQAFGAYARLTAERGLDGYRPFLTPALRNLLAMLRETFRGSYPSLRAMAEEAWEGLKSKGLADLGPGPGGPGPREGGARR